MLYNLPLVYPSVIKLLVSLVQFVNTLTVNQLGEFANTHSAEIPKMALVTRVDFSNRDRCIVDDIIPSLTDGNQNHENNHKQKYHFVFFSASVLSALLGIISCRVARAE